MCHRRGKLYLKTEWKVIVRKFTGIHLDRNIPTVGHGVHNAGMTVNSCVHVIQVDNRDDGATNENQPAEHESDMVIVKQFDALS